MLAKHLSKPIQPTFVNYKQIQGAVGHVVLEYALQLFATVELQQFGGVLLKILGEVAYGRLAGLESDLDGVAVAGPARPDY